MESQPIPHINQNQGAPVNQIRTNMTLMSQNNSINNSNVVDPQTFSVDYTTNSTFKSIEGVEMHQNNNP